MVLSAAVALSIIYGEFAVEFSFLGSSFPLLVLVSMLILDRNSPEGTDRITHLINIYVC